MKKRQPGEVKPGKRISESTVEMAEIVLPNDTNPLGTMLGGKVMHLIEIAGAIAAHRHSRRYVVTASVDNLEFQYPLRTGQVILLKAHVTRAFQTSMEVEVRVFLEDTLTGKKKQTSSAFLTYVALDDRGHPTEVPPLLPRTAEEKRRYEEARLRRRRRLSLRNRHRPDRSGTRRRPTVRKGRR